jgi:hypothetical protein
VAGGGWRAKGKAETLKSGNSERGPALGRWRIAEGGGLMAEGFREKKLKIWKAEILKLLEKTLFLIFSDFGNDRRKDAYQFIRFFVKKSCSLALNFTVLH